MPRFLHTADLQIGRQYAQFPQDDAVILAQERTTVVEKIAKLAVDHAVDAVLVAGDVFDAQTVSDRTIRKLFAATAQFAGVWVFIPGNHDAALVESVWTRAKRLGAIPPNAQVLLVPGVYEIPSIRVAVLAAPLTQRHTYNDATEFFDGAPSPDGWVRVGLAHGSVDGLLADDIDSSNPISATRCASARLDYLALGDWHGMRIVNPRCAYSGTPEQDRFRGNEPGYCLLVDVEPGHEPRIQPIHTGRYAWKTVAHTLAVASDVDVACASLAATKVDDVIQVQITGRTDLVGFQRLTEALGRAEAVARSLLADTSQLQLIPTDDDIATLHADGYLAEVIDELRQEQSAGGASSGTSEVAREALAMLCAELAPSTAIMEVA